MTILRRDVPLAFFDYAIAMGAYLVALALRFEGRVPGEYWDRFWEFIPFAALVHVAANYVCGLYRQMWRYASIREARLVAMAGAMAVAMVLGASELFGSGRRILPLSVAALGSVLALLGFAAVRFQSRLFGFRRRSVSRAARTLIVGAGRAAEKLLRDLARNPELGLEPVGLVDDDPRKGGRRLLGVSVLGTRGRIPSLVRSLRVDQVILAIPSAASSLVREVVAACDEASVRLRVLPSVREIVDGRVAARDIRDLQVEDLLGREQVAIDVDAILRVFEGRRVLITGAGGSIGGEIARQVRQLEPSALVLLDRDETHLHELVQDLADRREVELVLADVRDSEEVRNVFARVRPDIVFHAAAHKHLPILEQHPREAVLTNVLGTRNVAEAAVTAGVSRFVLISTDKAVKPTSVMGASKWIAEQVVWTMNGNGCRFSAVRFGNVIGSRGGVVQTFLRQSAEGGPVTVTHPDMARYFMSIHEAVQLVLQAAALARGGEVFTLDMGEPVSILELARSIIRLTRGPGDDGVDIEFVGRKTGEKLVEDLLDPDENPAPSEHPAILVSRPSAPDPEALRRLIDELEGLAATPGVGDLAARMKALTAREPRATTLRAEA